MLLIRSRGGGIFIDSYVMYQVREGLKDISVMHTVFRITAIQSILPFPMLDRSMPNYATNPTNSPLLNIYRSRSRGHGFQI